MSIFLSISLERFQKPCLILITRFYLASAYSLVPDRLAQLKTTDNRNHRHNLRGKRFAVFVLPGLGFVDAEAFPIFFPQLF